MAKKQIKVGVKRGTRKGADPPYQWGVAILDLAFNEVRKCLTQHEYDHMAMQVKELAREDDPTHPQTASVKAIEKFYELREKGGVLGRKNMRLFFMLDKRHQAIVILGGIKKENEGQTPAGTKIAIERRRRKYEKGDYGRFPK